MRGKRYQEEFKYKLIKELEGASNPTLVPRRYNLIFSTVTCWVRRSKE